MPSTLQTCCLGKLKFHYMGIYHLTILALRYRHKLGECTAPDITRQGKMKKGKQMSIELLVAETRREINLKGRWRLMFL